MQIVRAPADAWKSIECFFEEFNSATDKLWDDLPQLRSIVGFMSTTMRWCHRWEDAR